MNTHGQTEQQSYVTAVRDAAETLAQGLERFGAHPFALDALLAAYVAIAQTHPCCTFSAGLKARRAGMALVEHAANQSTRH